MDSIVYRQQNAAKALTGRGFALAVAGILLRLAIAQMVVSLLILVSGQSLLNAAVYLYAVWLLFDFMRSAVARHVYTLRSGSIILERRLGDSTIALVEIPLERIVAVRPVKRGERLHTTYRRVKVIDPACRPALRVRAAFVLSLISAHLARLCAGKGLEETIGYVLVFDADNQRCACVFAPDEKMCAALAQLLGDAYDFDERMTHARIKTLYSRALERAFPALYPYVDPLVSREGLRQAMREMDWQNAQLDAKLRALAGSKRARDPVKNHPADMDKGHKEAQPEHRRRRRKQEINDEIHDDPL